nr:polyadenylate-binding protein RBP45-like isoform X1 [Tanacetum cinerariifolium]
MMQQPGNGMAPPQYQQQQQQQPQQQWMMPQQHPPHMWAQQQVAPQQMIQQYGGGNSGGSGDEIKSLWIGDLQYWMDETYVSNCFLPTGDVATVKIIRNKQSGQPEGYGFIEFRSRAGAENALQTYNGTPMPSSEQNFRLNWATLGAGTYPSCKGAKVVTDRTTGRSKGYGFVRFGDESEQMRAMTEMNGVVCSSRPMRIGPAATKSGTVGGMQKAPYQSAQGSQGESDPNNTTIFVGGLDPSVSDDVLRQVFGQFGELIHVKIPVGKRCGFVQFANRACAEQALSILNGTELGGQSVRLSWGRSPSSKQVTEDYHYISTPDESVAAAGSSISITRLAVTVRRGTSWAAREGLLVFTFVGLGARIKLNSVLTAFAEYVFSAGIPSFGALVRQSTTVENTLSSTQKKRLFQFLKESKGLPSMSNKNCDKGRRKLANSKNFVYTPTLPSGKSTILSSGPGSSGCSASGGVLTWCGEVPWCYVAYADVGYQGMKDTVAIGIVCLVYESRVSSKFTWYRKGILEDPNNHFLGSSDSP